mgnify:CR=1 FL=1
MSLDELEEQVERIYVDMENELLLNIAKKLSAGKPMEIDKWDEKNNQPLYGSGGVNEWQLERLKELNGLNQQNAKIIAKYSGKTLEEVEKVFSKAKEIGTEANASILEMGIKAGILNEIDPRTEEEQVKATLNSAIQEVLTTFNKQNNSLLASAGQEYTDIVNKVSSQVLAGTKTLEKAMQEAVSQLAEKGLTGFTAKNGARWSPEAYTKMVLRTNTQNTINHIQEEQMALAGNDYWEISNHSGARPKCADDQGQIFSISGNTKPIVDGTGKKIKVRSWSSSSYGQPDGILGINCGHSRRSFVPGLSIHRDNPMPRAENDEEYIEKQRQRQYERTIRNKKREIAMLKQTGAEDSYIRRKQNSLSNTRKEYLEFLNKTGRTRITANEWIGSITLSLKSETKKVLIKKDAKSIINDTRNLVSNRLQTRTKGVKINRINERYSYYETSTNKIRLGNNADEYTLIHELGHKLAETFTKTEKKEYNKIIKNKFSGYQKSDFKKVKGKAGEYWVLKDTSEFVSTYQTRIYDSAFSFVLGKVNIHLALEYISEGLKYYYKNPALLKQKDENLYEFIDKVVRDE